MARITDLPPDQDGDVAAPRRRPAKAKQQQHTTTPAPVSYFIWLVPALTVAFSVYCNYRGMQSTPHGWLSSLMASSPAGLRAQSKLPRDFLTSLDSLPYPFDRLHYVLHLFFVQAASTTLGQGELAILSSIAMPWIIAELIEAVKPGQKRAPLGIEGFVLVATIAGVLMLGCFIPLVTVPAMAAYGWRQASKKPQVIRPLPSPSAEAVTAVAANVAVSGLPILALLLIDSAAYPRLSFYNNIAAVVFPLAWLPLVLVRSAPAHIKEADRSSPRLAASSAYRLLAYLTVPAWWTGAFTAIPRLLRIWRSGAAWPDDASSLLFWDTLGLLAGAYALVLVQAEIDFRAVQCGGPRVHRARLLIEDVVFGSTGLLLLGPGFAFSMYLARREVLAEKARWGVAPAFVEEAEKLDDEVKKAK